MNLQEILAKLIAIPSVSGDENEIANFIVQFVQRRTLFKAERIGHNVIVRVEGEDRRRCIIFNGHIDTVEAGEPRLWRTDPSILTEKDGLLYGLGASDMKGGVAAMLSLLTKLAKRAPTYDVVFMFVGDEETTGAGTHETLDFISGELARYETCYGIIAEPTDGRVAIGHRGNVFAEVTFNGKGAHASTPPEKNKQAIFAAMIFVQSIPDELAAWQSRTAASNLGNTTIAVTGIESGDHASANQVPTSCTVRLDIRTNELLYPEVPKLLNEWTADHKATAKVLSQCSYGYCPPESPIVRAALAASGIKETLIMPSSTDQCFFTERGIPAIIWGPGSHTCIHAPNEYISKMALEKSVANYMRMLDSLANA